MRIQLPADDLMSNTRNEKYCQNTNRFDNVSLILHKSREAVEQQSHVIGISTQMDLVPESVALSANVSLNFDETYIVQKHLRV